MNLPRWSVEALKLTSLQQESSISNTNQLSRQIPCRSSSTLARDDGIAKHPTENNRASGHQSGKQKTV